MSKFKFNTLLLVGLLGASLCVSSCKEDDGGSQDDPIVDTKTKYTESTVGDGAVIELEY